jgi:hypothetical protein
MRYWQRLGLMTHGWSQRSHKGLIARLQRNDALRYLIILPISSGE